MEYRSKAEFLGLPLVHLCLATPSGEGLRRKHARGWIAIGDTAIGVLLAVGGGAVGLVAIGGASVGLISFGGCALGGLALGGCAMGFWAIGGAAFGLQAALGGLAIASEYALGGLAKAFHANDEAAKQFFTDQPLLRMSRAVMDHSQWFLLLLLVPIWVGLRNRGCCQEPTPPRDGGAG